MKIIPLSEGSFTIDQSKIFVSFNETTDDLQQRNRGSLLVEIQPFVVITSKDVILLDTGLGFDKNGEPQLVQNIKTAGINPTEITTVLNLLKYTKGPLFRKHSLFPLPEHKK